MVLLAGGTSVSAATTPAQLEHTLLTTQIPASELPAGFGSAVIGPAVPSANAKSHHVVGEVQVEVNGGAAGLFFAVFPNHADALADFEHPAPVANKITARLVPPSWLPKPNEVETGTITGKNAAGRTVSNGITAASFVDGEVAVGAVTTSTAGSTKGDSAGTLALARFAIEYLKKLESA